MNEANDFPDSNQVCENYVSYPSEQEEEKTNENLEYEPDQDFVVTVRRPIPKKRELKQIGKNGLPKRKAGRPSKGFVKYLENEILVVPKRGKFRSLKKFFKELYIHHEIITPEIQPKLANREMNDLSGRKRMVYEVCEQSLSENNFRLFLQFCEECFRCRSFEYS